MKQLKMGFLALVLFMAACQKNTTTSKETELESTESTPIAQRCASQEVLEQQMAADPGLRQRREAIEAHTQQVLSNRSHRLMNDGTIEIPVVVHVIYRTADENISTAQVESQIAVLNEDFTNTNLDSTKANSSRFGDFNTNVGIRFTLKEIIRIPSSKRSWSTNDDMKFTSKGGSNTVDPQNNLNMWVVNKMTSYGSTILGYAQFPGGAWATDGVVIAHNYFGRIGKVSAPYHLGRTATHEVGHWINLRHIWGDATCGNDLVEDTPQHNTSNGGCPSSEHKSTCTGTPYEMWMNYMDYTYDECMYMFTHKQKDRMRAVFASGAFRAAMAQ